MFSKSVYYVSPTHSLDSTFYYWERKELEQDSHSKGERAGLVHSRGTGLLSQPVYIILFSRSMLIRQIYVFILKD